MPFAFAQGGVVATVFTGGAAGIRSCLTTGPGLVAASFTDPDGVVLMPLRTTATAGPDCRVGASTASVCGVADGSLSIFASDVRACGEVVFWLTSAAVAIAQATSTTAASPATICRRRPPAATSPGAARR